jgi:tRNA-Thr(GGU) m(6)t(6)A37 methyltransferase TsaA
MSIVLEAIGHVRGSRREAIDDNWGETEAEIVLDTRFPEDALLGIEEFSHVEVIFHFHQVPDEKILCEARHPRGNKEWPLTGIFAQRGKNRPNRVGSTICRVVGRQGRTLRVAELDAIDGTPVLDIKPVMREFLPRTVVRQPGWASALMAQYWDAGQE